MKRKVLSGLLCMVMLFNLTACNDAVKDTKTNEKEPQAEENVQKNKGKVLHSGSYGSTTWTIYENGLLEVKGTGDMYDIYDEDEDEDGIPEWCNHSVSIESARIEVSGATNLNGFFKDCAYLTDVDLSKLDTSNVTNMNDMFYDCGSLTSIDLSNFDTSNVTNMRGMFENCSSLTDIDVSNFDTSNVTSMHGMFDGCSSLTDIDVSNFDTSNVTSMMNMFCECSSLTSIDLSNFDASNCTDLGAMSGMISDCSGLTTIQTPMANSERTCDLPGCPSEYATWIDDYGNTYEILPTNTFESITLTRE